MKIGSGRVLDRLPAEEPCLAALFSSFGFDPGFFEDHVVRAVLRLTSDPVEQAERYHHEARRALQETPVAVIVDAGHRRPGRRLPYDLLEVSTVVFHPKSALLLYRGFARLLIGSGNLTSPGYGGNTELFVCTDLAYDEPADAALLTTFDQHLGRVMGLVRSAGTQVELIRAELRRRLAKLVAPSSSTLALVDSTTRPILDQLVALLPDDAVIESIGLLAPFYERDDVGELSVTSVFGALGPRAARDATLDVGVGWDNPQVQATSGSTLIGGLGRLWTWAFESNGVRVLEHLVPTKVGPTTLQYLDERGIGHRWPLDEVHEAIERRALWMQPPPIAFAPAHTIAAASQRFAQLRVWLHPATQLVEGRPLHRPLHAKLLVVSYRSGRSQSTLVLIGSANMSRPALLLAAGPGQGNVEVGLVFRLAGTVTLRELVPSLVQAPMSAFELREREFPELGRNYGLAIEQATHDPRAQTLAVIWSEAAAQLPAWRLTYGTTLLASASAAPTEAVEVEGFTLEPASAEVVLHVEGDEYAVPILVTDLVALPAASASAGLGLNELLMLLARRIGVERALQVAARRAVGVGDGDELGTFFGEGFGPTDVFRAWWSVADDLGDASLSVQALRLRLEGSLGVGAAWTCMLDAVQPATLSREEVWFYGAELLRELGLVELPAGEDREAKTTVLASFCARVREDLAGLGFEPGDRAWVGRITAFYGESKP